MHWRAYKTATLTSIQHTVPHVPTFNFYDSMIGGVCHLPLLCLLWMLPKMIWYNWVGYLVKRYHHLFAYAKLRITKTAMSRNYFQTMF